MAKIVFGNHASVFVPRQDRDKIRKFYCDVLGGKMTSEEDQKDLICIGDNFHIAFLYGDYKDDSEFLRSGRSIWLEIKSDDVEAMRRKILESGVVMMLDIPDPHLYFQAPGGQCLRLVGINEDLSRYEGIGEGPNVEKAKEAVKKMTGRNYTATIEVSNSPKDVFNHIIDVAKWWGGKDSRYEGSSAKLNDEFIIRHGEHYSQQKLIELIPDKKVVWLVTDSKLNWLEKDKYEWTNTKMVFDITTKNDKTVLHFTHEGLVPEKECYSKCVQGWNILIKEWLFNFISHNNSTHK